MIDERRPTRDKTPKECAEQTHPAGALSKAGQRGVVQWAEQRVGKAAAEQPGIGGTAAPQDGRHRNEDQEQQPSDFAERSARGGGAVGGLSSIALSGLATVPSINSTRPREIQRAQHDAQRGKRKPGQERKQRGHPSGPGGIGSPVTIPAKGSGRALARSIAQTRDDIESTPASSAVAASSPGAAACAEAAPAHAG